MSVATTGGPTDPRQRIGPFELDLRAATLCRDGERVKLGARAFDVLAALAAQRGRTLSKGDLLDTVWPDVVVEENNLQVQISALRKLLGPSAIATIPGRGYRLIGDPKDESAASSTAAPAGPEERRTGNLPAQSVSLIGRDDELARLTALVKASKLVTLVGPGGIGKTRLALVAAHRAAPAWRDGAWLVELAPLADAAALPRIVSQALRLQMDQAEPSIDALVRALEPMNALLLLDNCEHLVGAAAELCEALATRAPGVSLLVTSQELLNVPHEQVFPLGPLALPAADTDALAAEPPAALALFAERAHAADPRFALGQDNLTAVAEICRRLDGLPLAIELAAARVRHLGAHGLRDMLDDRFRILTGGRRAVMPRHRTLQATLEWSHSLLAEDERAVLQGLAVFVGGFTLELAQALAADDALDEWAVLDALGHLVDKSLVAAEGGDRPRYRLLETTRAFALDRLGESDRTAEMVERHAQVMLAAFEAADEGRYGERGTLDPASYMRRLLPELGNLRAAMDWALSKGGDVVLAARLAGASSEMIRQCGVSQQGLTWMRALGNRPPAELDDASKARFWQRLAMLGSNGRLPIAEATAAARQAVDIHRRIGPDFRLYESLRALGWGLAEGNDVDAAMAVLDELRALERPDWPARYAAGGMNLQATILLQAKRPEEALAVWREVVDMPSLELGEESVRQSCQANLCFALNCLQRHEEVLVVAQAFLDQIGHQPRSGTNYLLTHLLVAQTRLGRLDDARGTIERAVPEWRRDLSLRSKCAELAFLFASLGQMTLATRLDGAAAAFSRTSGYRANVLSEEARSHTQALFDQASLVASDVERWREEGAKLDEDAIVALCLAAPAADDAT